LEIGPIFFFGGGGWGQKCESYVEQILCPVFKQLTYEEQWYT